MMKLLAELKRRQMFRVAAAYAVVAWLILQVVNNLAPGLNLPNWAITLVIVLLAAGFPIALLFCWIQQLAPGDGAQAQVKVNRLDGIMAGGLAAVIALLLYQQLAPAGAPVAQDKTGTGYTAQTTAPTGVSIAVLPFANLSGDASQEFFSDGMTEEITAALARVPNLRVVGRTSAFQFKGQTKDFAAIRQALGVAYLIDGSVRREGDRVRITAQLVQADGTNAWTESYDRQLTSVFATQEEIATAIAASLRAPLGLRPGENLVRGRTQDTASYDDYLRAKSLVRARGLTRLTEATRTLEQIVARDANYAPAWALLAQAYDFTPLSHPAYGGRAEFRDIVEASLPRAEAAAQRAIQLDAGYADGYVALGFVREVRGNLLLAEELYARALALDPNNPEGLSRHRALLAGVGRLKEALEISQRLQVLEPFVPRYNNMMSAVLWLNGQNDAAIAMLNDLPPAERWLVLPRIYASMARYGDAADAQVNLSSSISYPGEPAEEFARLMRSAPAAVASPQDLPRMGILGYVYAYVGAPERALEWFEDNAEAGYSVSANNSFLWQSSYAPLRKTERFKALMRKTGVVDYWRAKGWPDLCRPVGADDFVCD